MRYAELHAKTNFSFLEGASHPDELVAQAHALGYHALAITDRESVAGVVRAHTTAKELGLKLIIGAEVSPTDAPPLVLWAPDRAAYGRLCRLLTRGRRNAPKGECRLTLADVEEHAAGLIAGVVGNLTTEGTEDTEEIQGRKGKRGEISRTACYRDIFPGRCYLLAELHRGLDDAGKLDGLVRLSRETGIPLVAAGDVHFHSPARRDLCDVLTATRLGMTVAQAAEAGHLFANAQRHLRPTGDVASLFAACPQGLARTVEIADRCAFSLDELRYEYPEELAPEGQTPLEYLVELTWAGAAQRYPAGVPDRVRQLLAHELELIGELRYEAYFLTVWDLVRFARSREILCQGRGSAANSAVCFALGVTSVDPGRIDVLFERFISRERNEAPDIDVDFEHERREEVLQYLYEKYGRDRAGLTAVTITYRPRSAVRDVGKALGFAPERLDALAKSLDRYSGDVAEILETRRRDAGLPDGIQSQQLVRLTAELLGFPRHLSQHVGGMVMTRGPLCEVCPIENAAMADRTVIQWNKDDLDELGILKVDVLALGMLSAIRKCFELVKRSTGRELSLATVPAEDPVVYDMIDEADTMGVFQIESRAQMSMLPRLRPRCFYDLVIEVAIVRPGPIQGDMVHPYLRRRADEEEAVYPSEAIRGVLEKTLGVPLFQEQAMRLAVVAAGFTPGEADQLRRAMGAWRKTGVIAQFKEKLIRGMLERGLSEQFAEQVFHQIKGFGEYGFPESHAASFALLVYVSAWLKRYYPAAFAAALVNSQPMGFYAPAQLIQNARQHGVKILPADVNFSDWDCGLTTEGTEEMRRGRFEVRGSRLGGLTTKSTKEGEDDKFQISNFKSSICNNNTLTFQQSPSSSSSVPSVPSVVNLRLGLRLIVGLSKVVADAVVAARARGGAFRSFDDFTRRTRLSRAALCKLAEADVFGSLGLSRRQALWLALGRDAKPREMPLFDEEAPARLDDEPPPEALPAQSDQQQVFADYKTSGLSLRAHPISFYRQQLDTLGVLSSTGLATAKDGSRVRVAGIVLLRQRPSTAKGITFVTLEDETGTSNLVVHPGTWQRFHPVAHGARAMIARGRLESRSGVIHVIVERLDDLSQEIKKLRVSSRDFR